jgi:hypothetical protein
VQGALSSTRIFYRVQGGALLSPPQFFFDVAKQLLKKNAAFAQTTHNNQQTIIRILQIILSLVHITDLTLDVIRN